MQCYLYHVYWPGPSKQFDYILYKLFSVCYKLKLKMYWTNAGSALRTACCSMLEMNELCSKRERAKRDKPEEKQTDHSRINKISNEKNTNCFHIIIILFYFLSVYCLPCATCHNMPIVDTREFWMNINSVLYTHTHTFINN